MPQTDVRLESLRTKLFKLQNSEEYQDAYSKLKEEILEKGEYKPSMSRIEAINISRAMGEKYKQKGFSAHDTSLVENGFLSHFEYKIRTERLQNSFFRLSRDMRGSNYKYISFEKIKRMLLEENINKHRILIPGAYSDFKDRWRLICLFDPNKPSPIGFDPFFREPEIVRRAGIPHDKQPYIQDFRCDLRASLNLLLSRLEEEIRFHKAGLKLKEKRARRYSEMEVSKIGELINKGHNLVEIFKNIYPEHKNFNYKHYIENPRPTRKEKEGARLYRRILRIAQYTNRGK